jgi:prepilin signal peptidase PulO-like enzyme (type II secretory pathway)
MLSNLPFIAQILLLGILGLGIGVLVNWAIYGWAMFRYRPISPWMPPAIGAGESPRQRRDYWPILGWPGRARDAKVYGNWFWLRPMLIEITWMLALPWFFLWLAGGNLIGGTTLGAGMTPPSSTAETWFWLYSIFLGLMCIGTFIDFDEKTIPDEVTIPGTIVALLFATFAPCSRLPDLVPGGLLPPTIESVTFASPYPATTFHSGTYGLLLGVAVFAIWIWALMPKLPPWYAGWGTSLKFMYAHAFRPKRKTKCELRTTQRSMPVVTKFLCALLLAGVLGVVAAYFGLPKVNWESLYGSLMGLAFGGAMIWSIRIIGTYALQKEAMGFGDVTLMAMIGATLGWQATLIAFVYAMVVVVLGLTIQVILTGSQALAFGPYLCAGAAITIFRWDATWPGAKEGAFVLGQGLLWILAGSLVLMAIMLLGLVWIKGILGFGDGD